MGSFVSVSDKPSHAKRPQDVPIEDKEGETKVKTLLSQYESYQFKSSSA